MNANETMNQPQSVSFTIRKLKKSASGVLASFRPSTYPEGMPRTFTRCGLVWEKARLGARGLGW